MTTELTTTNPYWDEAGPQLLKLARAEVAYYAGECADYMAIIEQGMKTRMEREGFVRRYAWAVPDPMSLAFVVEQSGRSLVEIGAGNGYWAWQLTQLGVDVVAYDCTPPDQEINCYFCQRKEPYGDELIKELAKTWHPVSRGGPEVLSQYADRTLFLCWPPYDNDMAAECLEHYPGRRCIYTSEACCGCTADDAFFKALDTHWNEVASHRITQWYGIHDEIVVYERKG